MFLSYTSPVLYGWRRADCNAQNGSLAGKELKQRGKIRMNKSDKEHLICIIQLSECNYLGISTAIAAL